MLDLFGEIKNVQEDKIADDPNKDLSLVVSASKSRYQERRIKSELALEKSLPWHFERGTAYHCFSFGDVDSISYLRAILKQQQLEYALLSTWAISPNAVDDITGWLQKGLLGRIDIYCGNLFRSNYATEYARFVELLPKYGGRVAIFNNHSKAMAGFGEHFDFAICSSANANVNPRLECTVITVDTNLARFYKETFDKVKSLNREFDSWQSYKLKRDETV